MSRSRPPWLAHCSSETVTFTAAGTSNTRAVRATLADYDASEVLGRIQAGDRRVVVRAGDIDPPPTTADTVAIDFRAKENDVEKACKVSIAAEKPSEKSR